MSDASSRLRAALTASPPDPDELAAAYRSAAADLARVRSDPARAAEEPALQQQVARAHARLFRPRRLGLDGVIDFVTAGWAELLHRRRPELGVATGLFGVAAVLAFLAVLLEPAGAVELLSPGVVAEAEARLLQGHWAVPSGPLHVVGLAAENGRRAAETIAFGVSFGLGTVRALLENGAFVGALYGVAWHHDGVGVLGRFMAPHAVFEFPAIFVAGAGGLSLGRALVAPGDRSRRAALREVADDVLGLAALSGGLLLVAACVEGLLSPIVSSVGAGTLVLLELAFVGWWWRRARSHAA